MLNRDKVFEILNGAYGLDSEGPKAEDDFLASCRETYYFDVEFLDPVSLDLPMSVTYSLLGNKNPWDTNRIEIVVYFPAGIKPILSADQEAAGFGLGKGNSNWSVQKNFPLDITEEQFETALDEVGDLAIELISATGKF